MFQMKFAWLIMAAVVVVLSQQVAAQNRPNNNRPGRFLSLPNAQKCANRKATIEFIHKRVKFVKFAFACG